MGRRQQKAVMANMRLQPQFVTRQIGTNANPKITKQLIIQRKIAMQLKPLENNLEKAYDTSDQQQIIKARDKLNDKIAKIMIENPDMGLNAKKELDKIFTKSLEERIKISTKSESIKAFINDRQKRIEHFKRLKAFKQLPDDIKTKFSKALQEIKTVTTKQGFNDWVRKHKTTINKAEAFSFGVLVAVAEPGLGAITTPIILTYMVSGVKKNGI